MLDNDKLDDSHYIPVSIPRTQYGIYHILIDNKY